MSAIPEMKKYNTSQLTNLRWIYFHAPCFVFKDILTIMFLVRLPKSTSEFCSPNCKFCPNKQEHDREMSCLFSDHKFLWSNVGRNVCLIKYEQSFVLVIALVVGVFTQSQCLVLHEWTIDLIVWLVWASCDCQLARYYSESIVATCEMSLIRSKCLHTGGRFSWRRYHRILVMPV